ncbi:MAG: adenosyl-hopene transferase HpnH [Pirellulales bacterium]
MSVPWTQMWTVLRYVVAQRLRGRKRYPLVLMLEPLLRCNLACAGCGKIQHPPEVLRQQLTPEQCWAAADECGAPVVSIPGGEPLLHPQIDTIVEGLVARRKYVYLCTNALRLEEMLPRFRPSRYLAFSIHLDGPREEHDHAVCRSGVFDIALSAIQAARRGGFRVTTNTTLFAGLDPHRFRAFFDQLMQLGVEGLTLAPGYRYAKAPDQDHFLSRDATHEVFRQLFAGAARRWRLNHTPLYLAFLQGHWPLECSPWGNPTYNVFGWQRPCYLLEEGSCATFAELMSETPWERYGRASGHAACRDCMAHCGYEPSAVADTFGSWRGWWATIGWHLGWSPRAGHAGAAPAEPALAPASRGSAAATPVPAATGTFRVSGATSQPAAPHLVQLQPAPPRVWES